MKSRFMQAVERDIAARDRLAKLEAERQAAGPAGLTQQQTADLEHARIEADAAGHALNQLVHPKRKGNANGNP